MVEPTTEGTQDTNKRVDFWLPLILLSLVGICIFLTESYDREFADGGLYSGVSAHGLALSKNLLKSDHPLFMFTYKTLNDGKPFYEGYNRFPVFPFLLIGLSISPFGNQLGLQVYVSRQLMNAFFFLGIIVVFMLVNQMCKNRYLALSVALLAFSSYYIFSYNDFIFNDIPALLGFVVALYAVVMAQKTKLKARHILFYSMFPICLGWQPYAVYVTWLLIDAVGLLMAMKTTIKARFAAILKQPSFAITGLAIIWGGLILGLQLFNEWRIVGGSFIDLPSVNSALWRTGFTSAAGHTPLLWSFDWSNYIPSQAHAITLMLIPFWPVFQVEPGANASMLLVMLLILYTLFKYLKERSHANQVQLVMILSGLLWTIPMRHFVALHNFQCIFYLGFAISVYFILLCRLSSLKAGGWKMLATAIAIVFLITVSLSNHLKPGASPANHITVQFQKIRDRLPADSKIYIDGDRNHMPGCVYHEIDFCLANYWFTRCEDADYVVSQKPNFNGEKLTANRDFNLFEVPAKR
ncbi:MAG: hypothetical protein ACLP05_09235 [Candidatus Kryptoniota bacterium]